MKHLKTLTDLLSYLTVLLAGLALVLMVGIVVADVGGRYFSASLSFNGAIEMVSILLLAVGFFGLPRAFAQGTHLNVEIATATVPPQVLRWLDAFWVLIGAAVCGYLAWKVLQSGLMTLRFGQVTEVLRLPMIVPYALTASALAIAAVVAVLTAVRRAMTHGDLPEPTDNQH
ncbi:TRAP transporter small permease [Roseinatronobacter alkalisoli]|uniref:TRAP transporter small permease protein n=1 Tax=Roseinatronobacter alkalisoli TaxID=3028235 RepID=A0ABT5TC30_9RHOB|nr:TRAP transporter small permease [Roseinatronobacter sp. HJB301]MDD7972682.1 TRAP transporter small permease [Roseinatronobacter sp. HJB301]